MLQRPKDLKKHKVLLFNELFLVTLSVPVYRSFNAGRLVSWWRKIDFSKQIQHLNYFLIFAAVLLITCTNGKGLKSSASSDSTGERNKTPRYIKSFHLQNPVRGEIFAFGQPVSIVIKPKKKAASIDSVQFFGDNKFLYTVKKHPWIYTWTPAMERMGKHQLKILAFHSNGSIGNVSTFVNVKSHYSPQKYVADMVHAYPHDRKAYTQGLLFHKGYLYEGTGQYGESSLRKVKLETGEVVFNSDLEPEYFGEGITYSNGKFLQLTWTSGKAFVYNAENFNRENVFYPQTTNKQCWGITTMDNDLVLSDGSNTLTVLDPVSFNSKGTIEVYDHLGKVKNLNELEYIEGKIYANVWQTDRIVIIDPNTGRVTAAIDLSGLLPPAERSRLTPGDDVLNGIAWDKEKKRLFVTGKRWPKLFEIRLKAIK